MGKNYGFPPPTLLRVNYSSRKEWDVAVRKAKTARAIYMKRMREYYKKGLTKQQIATEERKIMIKDTIEARERFKKWINR